MIHNYHNQHANDSPHANISILPKINLLTNFDIKLKLNLECVSQHASANPQCTDNILASISITTHLSLYHSVCVRDVVRYCRPTC